MSLFWILLVCGAVISIAMKIERDRKHQEWERQRDRDSREEAEQGGTR